MDIIPRAIHENTQGICKAVIPPQKCIVEGYIVNEFFFFMSDILKRMHIDAQLEWDGDHDEE